MLILKLIIRVVCFPLVVLCTLIKWLAIVFLTCGAHVLSPLMFFILACGIYTVCKQQWSQTMVLGILEAGCLVLLIGAGWIAGLAESIIIAITGA